LAMADIKKPLFQRINLRAGMRFPNVPQL